MAGITNIIPYFGPWIGGVLPVVLAIMDSPIKALWVAIMIVIVQQLEAVLFLLRLCQKCRSSSPCSYVFGFIIWKSFWNYWDDNRCAFTATMIVIVKHILN